MSTFLALATLSLVVSSQAAGLSSVAPNVVATTAPAVVATVAPVVSTITPAPTATAQAAGSTPSPLTEYLYPYAAIVSYFFLIQYVTNSDFLLSLYLYQ